SPAGEQVIDNSAITQVSPVTQQGGFNKFTVTLSSSNPLDGITSGDAVHYTDKNGNLVSGVVDSVDTGAHKLTVRFAQNLSQDPNATKPALLITPAGDVQDVAISNASLLQVSGVFQDATFKKFLVAVQGVNLPQLGVAPG